MTEDRAVTLSAEVWRRLCAELDDLHAFVQRVAERSQDAELLADARRLGADAP